MPPSRVLVVDDSVVIRKLLTNLLESDPEIRVVGTAPNGKIALAKIKQLNPDLVTLDMEMPEMDGLETLTEIKKINPFLPVIMCSSLTVRGGEVTLEALARGADDYVAKPTEMSNLEEATRKLGHDILPKIKALLKRKKPNRPINTIISSPKVRPPTIQAKVDILAIGASTGGPNALTDLLCLLPQNFPVPIVIVQHMPPLFTRLLAERLTAKSKLFVKEGKDGEELKPGYAWVAPGNFHMEIVKNGAKKIIRLNQNLPENSCRPAVDVLFRSVSQIFGPNVLSVILTGMGHDGLSGSKDIVSNGGVLLAQDEDSSVVWGMPGAVVEAGLASVVKPIDQLAAEIVKRVKNQIPSMIRQGEQL